MENCMKEDTFNRKNKKSGDVHICISIYTELSAKREIPISIYIN